MDDTHNKTVFELVSRLNQINVERQKLDIEYNKIVHELWDRLPNLKDDVNIQPKVLEKVKGLKNERP